MKVRSALLTAGLVPAIAFAAYAVRLPSAGAPQSLPPPATPFSDWRSERPGVMHKITFADLPAPYASPSARNQPRLVPRPDGAMPAALPGYAVTQYAAGLLNPRLLRVAPNGDLFVAESMPGRVKVVRGLDANGRALRVEVFATGLSRPFGIAFYPPGPKPQYVYVANTGSVVRFRYEAGDLQARGAPDVIVPNLPSGGQLTGGGHWTRDLAFSNDGRKMFVSVGSLSNVDDTDNNPQEKDRAAILEFNPDGSGRRVYASGIRNAVGIAIQPGTGTLWASVNERDELGDNLVPDYITHVEDGGFYGWPWYYLGGHQDPRHAGRHPELKAKVKVPDVLLQAHSASLQMLFYTGTQFPGAHRDSIFAAEHGSWNKSARTGYKVIRVPLSNGAAAGEYEDFVTGFVTAEGEVWGRPVGVAMTPDGALIVSDDGTNSLWRVSYTGSGR